MRALAAIVLSVALFSTVNADESGNKEDARRLFLAGRQAFEGGRLDVAASSFEAAYRLSRLPALLWNLGQTYQRQYVIDQNPQTLKRAVNHYRQYLQDAPTGPNRDEATRLLTELTPILARVAPEALGATTVSAPPPPTQKTELMIVTEAHGAQIALDGAPPAPAPLLAAVKAGEHRATIEAPGYFTGELALTAVDGRLVVGEARLIAKPGRVEVDGARGATVFVDGQSVGRLPLSPLELPAGRHLLSVTARGRNYWQQDLTLERGGAVSLRATLEPTTQRKAARAMTIVTGLAALVTVAAGAVWGQAESAAADLYDQQQRAQISPSQLAEYNGDRARRDSWRAGTFVALGITGALAVTTAGLFLFDQPRPPAAR
ncbi:MAG TPA: PEGA domain-containing protein [Polyangia bacterium]|nr:PEGA domain-containing protein [Polyangia bacterium]